MRRTVPMPPLREKSLPLQEADFTAEGAPLPEAQLLPVPDAGDIPPDTRQPRDKAPQRRPR